MKLVPEPKSEAKFECYEFRPGPAVHDAIKVIVHSVIKANKYVFDAHIANCFHRIHHYYLLYKIDLKNA